MLEMNVHQTGKNVAVIQPKCNNCDEGQILFFVFFSLPPLLLCTENWAEFHSLLFSHSDSVRRAKGKKSVLPHSHRKFIIMFPICK